MEVSALSNQVTRVFANRISTFHICAKMYHYTYRKQIAPLRAEPSSKFDKGNYTHELCHVYYQMVEAGMRPGSDAAWLSIRSRIQNDLAAVKDPETKRSLLPVYSIISAVMNRYIK